MEALLATPKGWIENFGTIVKFCGRVVGEAAQHHVDREAQAKLDQRRGQVRVRLAQQRHEAVDSTGPALEHEGGIEVSVGLEAADEAQVAQAGLSALRQQLDLRSHQRVEDLAGRGRLPAGIQRV